MVRKRAPQDATLRNVRAAHARLDNLADHVRVIDRMIREMAKAIALHETRISQCIDRMSKLNGRSLKG